MTRRLLPLVCAGVFALAGLALATAQEPPAGQDEPPLRLKKKKDAPGQKPGKVEPKAEPGKGDKDKPEAKKEKKKEPPKADDGKEAEPEEKPEIDEKEVLSRVAKNMRAVEDRLAKREIDDGTRQTQEDILKDLDSLIEQSQRGGGGGGGQQNDANQDQEQNQQDKQNQQNQGKSGQKGGSKGKQGGKSGSSAGSKGGGGSQAGGGGKSGRRMTRAQARALRRMQERLARGGRQGQGKPGGNKQGGEKQGDPMAKNQQGGGNQGGGGGTSTGPKNRNADLYKDVWGHLPEALRAEMNAYSNPQPFMPKYDDLIKKYYRTIAEQGRRKGD